MRQAHCFIGYNPNEKALRTECFFVLGVFTFRGDGDILYLRKSAKKRGIIMIFFYIRHGDPIYDPNSLTPLGERQAEALSKRLAVYGLDKIYASTSNRAILTAKPTCELLKKEMELLDFANEEHAWRELTVPREDGKGINWLFHHPKYKELLCKT